MDEPIFHTQAVLVMGDEWLTITPQPCELTELNPVFADAVEVDDAPMD